MSPELAVFDDSYFASLEQEIGGEAVLQAQAQAALGEVLAPLAEDGTVRSRQQIQAETEAFFANPWVRQSEQLMNVLSAQFAHDCMGHGQTEALQNSSLADVLNRGIKQLDDGHGHGETEQSHDHSEDSDDDDEIDPKTKKKKRAGRFIAQFFAKISK